MKCWAGWITSWNQDFQEKYQQPQICRWCHSNGRKWRGTQELLDEVEIGEWRSEFSNYDRGIWSHHLMANRRGEVEAVTDFIFLGSKITADSDCSHEIKRCLLLGRKTMTYLDRVLKSKDITLPTKVHVVKAMFFSSSHVWMWELNYKEGWTLKNWCLWIMVLEKTRECLGQQGDQTSQS